MTAEHKPDFNEAIEIIRAMASRFQEIEGRPWGAEGTIRKVLRFN
jgi:hypothetical protein